MQAHFLSHDFKPNSLQWYKLWRKHVLPCFGVALFLSTKKLINYRLCSEQNINPAFGVEKSICIFDLEKIFSAPDSTLEDQTEQGQKIIES